MGRTTEKKKEKIFRVRISEDIVEWLNKTAEKETKGNVSELMRNLISEKMGR